MKTCRHIQYTRWTMLLFGLFLYAHVAEAHPIKGEAVSFWTGVKHPISGLDHIVAMIAVGIWGAQLGAPAIWVLPVAFPIVMAFGGMLGLLGMHLPGAEFGIAASGIMLGAAIMMNARPRLEWAAILVGFFAIFHGYAHGSELPAGASGLLYSIGFVMATGCLHGVGITIGLLHRYSWGKSALRFAGAGISVVGCVFLWKAFA